MTTQEAGGFQAVACRSQFSVAILTEAGPHRGYGHLVRCLATYDAFDHLGIAAHLFVRGTVSSEMSEAYSIETVDWVDADPSQLLAGCDAVVVDSYEAPPGVFAAVAASVTATAFFDDGNRIDYPPGLVIHGSPGGQSDANVKWDLCGPRFQPLRKEFWDVPSPREVRTCIKRVLVVFGGTDASGMREVIASSLAAAFPTIEFDVVRCPRSAAAMYQGMINADVAVSAAGQTLYELARTGTPTVAVVVADNQSGQARALAAAGTLSLAGAYGDLELVDSVIQRVADLEDPSIRTRMSRAGRDLVDGRGALRVARALMQRVLDRRVVLIPARPPDETALLDLANDPVVRANSFSSELITAAEHHAWFGRVLADKEGTLILLAWIGGTLAGQVRFDISDTAALVGISISARFRGLGWGASLLNTASAYLVREHPKVRLLRARVKSDNVPSIRMFQGAGFSVTNEAAETNAIEYVRVISAP